MALVRVEGSLAHNYMRKDNFWPLQSTATARLVENINQAGLPFLNALSAA
jgi:hypothetical protein